MNSVGTLFFFCGKMGSGKSTYAKKLAKELNAILLSEDEWLSTIFPEEINDIQDYIKYSSRLKLILKEHIKTLLKSGLSVVMDFPGNTINQRKWFKEIFLEELIPHKLIYLKAEALLCLKRIENRRNNSIKPSPFDTKEVFYQITNYFQSPNPEEGFNLETIEQ